MIKQRVCARSPPYARISDISSVGRGSGTSEGREEIDADAGVHIIID